MSNGASAWASPHQSVAQKTKLCSAAMSWTFPAWTSVREPSSPWPYSEARAAAPVAARGMMQSNCAVPTLPDCWVGVASGFVEL